MPKISIIMPVYNVEKYLIECLESVVRQTLEDIEIICIDDGSKDRSSLILDEYAGKDSRIKVIHKENAGYGQTMNLGIQWAAGDYISIVEPDDYIDLNMMESLYKTAVQYNLDVVKANFAEFCGDRDNRVFKLDYVIDKPDLYNQVITPIHVEEIFRGYVLNQAGIYKSSFFHENHIKFHETPGASYQDVSVWFQVMIKAQRMMLVKEDYYRYRVDNPNSSMASMEKVYCICDEFNYLYNTVKEQKNFKEILPIYQYCRWNHYLVTLERVASQYKLQFIKKMQEDFQCSQEKGELNLSFFKEWEKESFMEMFQTPSSFFQKNIRLSNEIHEMLLPYNKVVIYGAGMLGKRILREMGREDREKLLGFAVTDTKDNLDLWAGMRIYPIDHFDEYKTELGVLVGVTNKYRQEIVDALQNKGYSHILIPHE